MVVQKHEQRYLFFVTVKHKPTKHFTPAFFTVSLNLKIFYIPNFCHKLVETILMKFGRRVFSFPFMK